MPCVCSPIWFKSNGNCPDCKNLTYKGRTYHSCQFSPIICNTCGYVKYLPKNKYLEWIYNKLLQLPTLIILTFHGDYIHRDYRQTLKYSLIEYLILMFDKDVMGEYYYNERYSSNMDYLYCEFIPLIWLNNKLKKEKEYTQIFEDDLPF